MLRRLPLSPSFIRSWMRLLSRDEDGSGPRREATTRSTLWRSSKEPAIACIIEDPADCLNRDPPTPRYIALDRHRRIVRKVLHRMRTAGLDERHIRGRPPGVERIGSTRSPRPARCDRDLPIQPEAIENPIRCVLPNP